MPSRPKKRARVDVKGISLRCFVSVFIPAWLLGCFILWLFHYAESDNVRASLRVNMAHTLELQKESIVLDFAAAVSDLDFLSRRIELSGFCDTFAPALKEDLDRELLVFLKSKKVYDRIAVIDPSGREVISVDFGPRGARITPDDHLHDRSQEHYFKESLQRGLNELYISPFELKVEHGMVQEPHEPIIRIGMPLADSQGAKKGVVVVHYYGRKLIDHAAKIASEQAGHFMVLNSKGYWIKGRSPDEEWGFMFEGGHGKAFCNSFPVEWGRISHTDAGAVDTDNGLFLSETLYLYKEIKNRLAAEHKRFVFTDPVAEDGYYWKLVGYMPADILEERSRQVFSRFRFIFLVMTASMLASYVFLVFAQYYRRCNADLSLEKTKMDQILDYGEKVRTITNLNTLIDFIIKEASDILESQRCSLMLLDEETGELVIRGAIGLRHDVIKQSKVSLGEGIAGLVAEEGKPLLVEVIDEDERIGRKSAPYYRSKSFLSVPIKLDHQLIGVVNVTDKKDKKNPTYTELDLKILLAIVRQAAVAIENAQLSKELKYLTITDPLTHLYNYRHLMECLAYEVKRFKRFKRPLCLLIIDVDDFKEYNDAFGQAEGNLLLKSVGRTLMEGLREVDIVCRYAGDEFVVILPDTEVNQVKVIAEKVRKAVEATKYKKKVTVSIGVAKIAKDMNRHDLILKADAALHKAKKDGKNRVFCQD